MSREAKVSSVTESSRKAQRQAYRQAQRKGERYVADNFYQSPTSFTLANSLPEKEVWDAIVGLSRLDPLLAQRAHEALSDIYYPCERKKRHSRSLTSAVSAEVRTGIRVGSASHEIKGAGEICKIQRVINSMTDLYRARKTPQEEKASLRNLVDYYSAHKIALAEPLVQLPESVKSRVKQQMGRVELKAPSKTDEQKAAAKKFHPKPLMKTPEMMTEGEKLLVAVMKSTRQQIQDINDGKQLPPPRPSVAVTPQKTAFEPLPTAAATAAETKAKPAGTSSTVLPGIGASPKVQPTTTVATGASPKVLPPIAEKSALSPGASPKALPMAAETKSKVAGASPKALPMAAETKSKVAGASPKSGLAETSAPLAGASPKSLPAPGQTKDKFTSLPLVPGTKSKILEPLSTSAGKKAQATPSSSSRVVWFFSLPKGAQQPVEPDNGASALPVAVT